MPQPVEALPLLASETDLLDFVLTDEELAAENDYLRDKSPEVIMARILLRFGQFAKLDTSCGRDSAVGWHMGDEVRKRLGWQSVDVAFGDTGFWPPETHAQKDALVERFPHMRLHVSRPDDDTVASVRRQRLWVPDEHGLVDSDLLLGLLKHKPMTRLDMVIGKFVSISAIHNDQTSHRQGLRDVVVRTAKGGLRAFPFLYWKQQDFDNYLDEHDLPRNECPMLDTYDIRTRRPVQHRQLIHVAEENRTYLLPIEECGLHTADGRSVPQAAA